MRIQGLVSMVNLNDAVIGKLYIQWHCGQYTVVKVLRKTATQVVFNHDVKFRIRDAAEVGLEDRKYMAGRKLYRYDAAIADMIRDTELRKGLINRARRLMDDNVKDLSLEQLQRLTRLLEEVKK